MSSYVRGAFIDFEHMPEELLPVLAYWKHMTPEGAIGPRWSQFDLMEIPSRFLPYSIVVEYDDETATFRYRYWGRKLTDVFRNDFTGKTFEELPDRFRDMVIQSNTEIVNSRKPRLIQFSIDKAAGPVRCQQAIRLPLSNDGINVSDIFSILSFPWEHNILKQEAQNHIWSE